MVLAVIVALPIALADLAAGSVVPVAEWAVEDAPEEDDDSHDQLLAGVRLPGLIDTSGIDVGLDAYGLYGARGEVTVDAELNLLGDVTHPFEGEIADLQLSIGLFEVGQASFTSDRLTRPPLQLTQADLDKPLPSPLASSETISVAEHVETSSRAEVELSEQLGELTVHADELPEYLLLTRSYRMVMPTAADVELIVDRGGMADHAALAAWANDYHDESVPFEDEERARLMERVRERFRRLRAPPALGDYQRLRSMVALIRTMASAEDVESLLRLERPLRILHTSAMLSYDLALRDEATLGMAVHGMYSVPGRSELITGSEAAYRSLRPMALEKLLRIAFDPVDFRDAPASFKKHRLRRQAEAMLEPLRPTDVNGVLGAADGRPGVQREALRFYLQVRHAPAAEPLVDWLSVHQDAVDDLGRLAVSTLPDAVLPAALQRYVDPRDPEHRAAMRRVLELMPTDRGPVIIDALRSLGVPVNSDDVPRPGAVRAAFDRFEEFERQMATERSAELVERLTHTENDPSSLRAALRDAGRLAQMAPGAIEANADELLELHAAAALEFDDETPLERMRALSQLLKLPWGSRTGDAKRIHAITEARIFIERGEPDNALDRLLQFDEDLAHPDVRGLFAEALQGIYDRQVATGQFDAATQTLVRAEEHVADEVPIEQLRRELSWKRYRPGYFLGGAFALALLSALTWLAVRGSGRAIKRWRRSRQELHRLMRRQEDAEASADEAAVFKDEETGVKFTELEDPLSVAGAEDLPPPLSPSLEDDGASDDGPSDGHAPDDDDAHASKHDRPEPAANEAPPAQDGEEPGPSDDPLDDPFADPFDWDSPFEDDIFGDDSLRASGD